MPTKKGNEPAVQLKNHYFTDLAKASLSGDHKKVQLVLLSAIRSVKKSSPDYAGELGHLLTAYSANPEALRRSGSSPVPEDSEVGMPLLNFPTYKKEVAPIYETNTNKKIQHFIKERHAMDILLAQGVEPPNSLLLKGKSGTGKTTLASWIASELNLPFVVLDLAVTISSYLGKTGANLKRCLDYARTTPCVFLLDEFDSIAKRRDVTDDVGELKRVVTVLLKELEDLPFSSVIIAATNHPELLDPAIERRFNLSIEIPKPNKNTRKQLFLSKLGDYATHLDESTLECITSILESETGSGIEDIAKASLRRHIIDNTPISKGLFEVLVERGGLNISKDQISTTIQILKRETQLTVRDIASIVGLSSSGVQHHLKKK